MLVSIIDVLERAKAERFGVAAPDAFNSLSVRACFEAAAHTRAPLILSCLGMTDMEECADLARFYAGKFPEVTMVLHLDHGSSYQEAMLALRYGFTSVMIDRSKLSYEDNVREVKEVVKAAHAMGVSVEAELGHVGQGAKYAETRDAGLTRKEEAKTFVEETGVDCLAVAIGTSHGTYKGTPYLDFDLLKDLSSMVHVPLVLHGGSGTGDDNLKKCIQLGIQKINLFTDLADPAAEAMYALLGGTSDDPDILKTLESYQGKKKNFLTAPMAGAEVYRIKLERYIRLFGSAGKA